MPYLSWQEEGGLRRERLEGARVLGSDPQRASLLGPAGGAPVQALVQPEGAAWRIRPLDGAVVRREGAMLPAEGVLLEEGDTLAIGAWEFRFSETFPGLDRDRFWETARPIPLPAGPAAVASLRWIAGLAQRLEQGLMSQEDPSLLSERLIGEARSFMSADTGIYLGHAPGEPFRALHVAGRPAPLDGPLRALADHALRGQVSLLSNDPKRDPRVGEPVEGAFGPVLVAPVSLEETGAGEMSGAVFILMRAPGGPGFDPADLSLLKSAADLAALAHRLSLVHRRLLTQAELESQLLHARRELERQEERNGRLLASLRGAILRAQALVRRVEGPAAEALHLHLSRMSALVDEGQSTDPGLSPPPGRSRPLSEIQSELLESWAILAEALSLKFEESAPPREEVWVGGGPILEALHGLMDATLLQLPPGTTIPLRWRQEPGHVNLDILLPPGSGRTSPDAWSREVLNGAGVDWRWNEGGLSLAFRESPKQVTEEAPRLMLGLVTEDLALSSLFQGASDAGGLGLFPLEEEPPAPPLPPFEILVVDARGVKNAVNCLRAYRAHPSFAMAPVLVVRAREQDGPELLSAGATDWLPGPLKWESLHHRLQALRRHRELQQRGRAAERLDTVRQMAGTLKHEINNPLAVISLQTELLQRKYPDEAKLSKIAEQVQRIQSLMQVLQKMREASDEEYPGGTNILKV